jgi:endonuclease/exonuclease/phosphatase family metal-dependent hydrolase
MCTHFDDQGQISRTESAKLILKVIGNTTQPAGSASPLPVFLAGDLNSEPNGSAYQILNGASSSVQDVKDLAGWKYGDKSTFTGFEDKVSCLIIWGV